MAKSDSNSNDLRQDQPEWVPAQGRGVRRVTPHMGVWSLSKGVRGHSPTECHRTIRANIRSHLDGGPQGWNPHVLRTCLLPRSHLKGFESRRRADLAAVRLWTGFDGPVQASFAFIPSALLYLRASERVRVETARREPPSRLHPNALLHLRATDVVRPGGGRRPAPRSHLIPMAVPHLTPSNRAALGTRLHGGESLTLALLDCSIDAPR